MGHYNQFGLKHLILLLILFPIIFLSGCATRTTDMKENTQVNLKAQTPVGEITVVGTIDRTQHTTSELKINPPQWVKPLMTTGFGMMSGGLGIGGLGTALYAIIRRRRDREAAEKKRIEQENDHDKKLTNLIKEKEVHLMEICKGVSKWMNKADPEAVTALKQSLKETMSRDTRGAVQDYI